MEEKYRLEILTPAQRELEDIAILHMELVGPDSARKISDRIYTALEKLKTFPDMGILCRDKQLALAGYRMLICGNYLCLYRLIGTVIFIYHIVDGRSDYQKLFSDINAVSED